MIKTFIITITILFFIIITLAVINKSLTDDLEKAQLHLENFRIELASSVQSLRTCEEKIAEQNISIEAYILDMGKKRNELAKKNAALKIKYENLLKTTKPPLTCSETINLIDKQQEQFFE